MHLHTISPDGVQVWRTPVRPCMRSYVAILTSWAPTSYMLHGTMQSRKKERCTSRLSDREAPPHLYRGSLDTRTSQSHCHGCDHPQALLHTNGGLPQEALTDKHAAPGFLACGRHRRAPRPLLQLDLQVAGRRVPQPGCPWRHQRRHYRAQPGPPARLTPCYRSYMIIRL